jgi:hypothetical protein
VACHRLEYFLEEYRIAAHFGIEVRKWQTVVRDLNATLKQVLPDLPVPTAQQLVIRFCRRRKINRAEEEAMVEMCSRLGSVTLDLRSSTTAAIACWKVLEHSQRYYSRVNLDKLVGNHARLIQQGEIDKLNAVFDATVDNVRKVFLESITGQLYSRFLPEWEGRVGVTKEKGNYHITPKV